MSVMIPMKDIESQIVRNSALIREITLTFLGAGIQVAFSLSVMTQFVQDMRGSPQLVTGDQTFEIIYLLLPIFYCIPASLLFTPKRLISPLFIQLLTFVFAQLIVYPSIVQNPIIFLLQTSNGNQSVSAAQYSEQFSVLYFLILIVAGVVQFFAVRWVVGLNGNENDVNQKTFTFPVEYAKLKTMMLGRTFRSISGLTFRDGRRDRYILLANYAAGPEKMSSGPVARL